MIVAAGPKFPFMTTSGVGPAVKTDQARSRAIKSNGPVIIKLLRRRFLLRKSPAKVRKFAASMVDYAYDNFWTVTYSKFQLLTNGIPA